MFVFVTACTPATPALQHPLTKTEQSNKHHVDPDSDVPDDWFDGALSEVEATSVKKARAFVDAVFALVDRKIFDPTFKAKERMAARRDVIAMLASKSEVRRDELVAATDQKLKQTGMSHLRFIGPSIGKKFFAAIKKSADSSVNPGAVSMRMFGDIAVVRISSSTTMTNAKPLENCLVGAVLRWLYPKPKSGTVSVTFPFIFQPTK